MGVAARVVLLAGILPAIAATCALAGETAATPYLTEAAPLDSLARSFGFRVDGDMRSTLVRISSSEHQISIAPGLARALVDGRPVHLLSAPRHCDGVLVVGADLADLIRRLGDADAVGDSPSRVRPERGTRPKAAFLPIPARAAQLILAGGTAREDGAAADREETNAPLIVIDPGHGGRDQGARGARGTEEKEVVLDVALRTARALRAMGLRTQMTRIDDSIVDLRERAAMAARSGAAALISIHANSFHDPSVGGVETWVADAASCPAPSVRARSLRLARAVQAAVVGATRTRDRGVRDGTYLILKESKVPTALVEIGFLSNPAAERMLAGPRWREKIAQVLAAAIAAAVADETARAVAGR